LVKRVSRQGAEARRSRWYRPVSDGGDPLGTPQGIAAEHCWATSASSAQEASSGTQLKPQVRVLQALAKSKSPLTRSEISKKGEVDQAMLKEYIGSSDDKIRSKNDKKVCVSLLTRGYVKPTDKDGAAVYSITVSGRKALESAK
jgi:hypothetical protein